jgi:hypothetical protein
MLTYCLLSRCSYFIVSYSLLLSCWSFHLIYRNILCNVICYCSWSRTFLILQDSSVFGGGEDAKASPVSLIGKEKGDSKVSHSSNRKRLKMASLFSVFTSLLLCFCASSCLFPHSRRKRKYVTLMDFNFDDAYRGTLLLVYISSRDFSSIRSNCISFSGQLFFFYIIGNCVTF